MAPLPVCTPRRLMLYLYLHLHLHLLLLFIVSVQSFSAEQTTAPKIELFEYQQRGVDVLVADQRIVLGDEMGLGKTIQAVSALNKLSATGELCPDQDRVLIICPKSVLNVWVDELEQWLDPRPVSYTHLTLPTILLV